MSVKLPRIIAEYFASDRGGSPQAIAHCFTQNATVKDEGNRYQGRDAIHDWIAGASTEYSYTAEPFSIEERDGRTIVTSHLVGDFAGSPLDLRYFFRLDGEKIAELEIIE